MENQPLWGGVPFVGTYLAFKQTITTSKTGALHGARGQQPPIDQIRKASVVSGTARRGRDS